MDRITKLLRDINRYSQSPFVHPMFARAAYTGARRSELIRSQLSDIDMEAMVITFREKKRVDADASWNASLSPQRFAKRPMLCETPVAWRFGSQHRWKAGTAKEKSLLTTWPIPRHRDCIRCVTMALTDKEIKGPHWSKTRGCPFGEETWVESFARRFDLEMTLRSTTKVPERPGDYLNSQFGT